MISKIAISRFSRFEAARAGGQSRVAMEVSVQRAGGSVGLSTGQEMMTLNFEQKGE